MFIRKTIRNEIYGVYKMNLFTAGLLIILVFMACIEGHSAWNKSTPEFKAERQIEEYTKEISSGSRYITIELPISSDVERLLKEENYEIYMKLKENQKIIYKKRDK